MGKKQSKPKQGAAPTSVNIRVLLLGDPNIGKTSLLNKFVNGTYTEEKPANPDAAMKKSITVGKTTVNYEIVDVPEIDENMTSSAFTGVKVCIGLFDLTNPETKDNVRNVLGMATRFVTDDKFIKCICGLKADDEGNIKISDADIEEMLRNFNADKSFKVSSKEGRGIEEMFNEIGQMYINSLQPAK